MSCDYISSQRIMHSIVCSRQITCQLHWPLHGKRKLNVHGIAMAYIKQNGNFSFLITANTIETTFAKTWNECYFIFIYTSLNIFDGIFLLIWIRYILKTKTKMGKKICLSLTEVELAWERDRNVIYVPTLTR